MPSRRSARSGRSFRFPRTFRSRRARRCTCPTRRLSRAFPDCPRARGETVLIHGASGGVGIAAVQIARAAGLRVVGTAGSDRGRKLVLDEGAHEVLDHTAPDHFEKASGAHRRPRLRRDPRNAGERESRTRPSDSCAWRACGYHRQPQGNPEIDPRDIMGKTARFSAMSLWNATPDRLKSIHAALVAGLKINRCGPSSARSFRSPKRRAPMSPMMEPARTAKSC